MAKKLIATATASSSSSLSFTSGIDSTYGVYEFHFINIHPSDYLPYFTFQVNAVGQTGFNETLMSLAFQAYHVESGSGWGLSYEGGYLDLVNETRAQPLTQILGNDNDNSTSGVLTLYAPSSTTYVKHWVSRNNSQRQTVTSDLRTAGYINTTSAIDEISFQMSTGTIEAGTIKMFGVS